MTLVEMVIATAIFSLVMLAMITALNTFGRTYSKLDLQINQISRVREVDHFLRSALRSAASGPGFLQGTASELRWVAPVDRIGGAGGLQHLKLAMSDSNMILRFAPFEFGQDTALEPSWDVNVPATLLLSDVRGFKVAYKVLPEGSWQSEFGPQDDLTGAATAIPWAVKLEWGSSEREWPPLIVGLENHGMLQ